MNKYILPVYGEPDAPPCEIVCDTREAALAHMRRLREADRGQFERG